jgi:adenine-specific DNA-methyltransferase
VGDSETSENKIIHGDNLDALKSLLPEYEGKVKCIYIDPPYNTGNEWWVYNDNVSDPKLQKWLNQVVGKEWEDLTRHDKWLCMMYPRLKLLHKLLAPEGAIFISIDDNEQANLKLMMDEIFGPNNYVTNIVWGKKRGKDNSAKFFSKTHEYLVCYAKNIPKFVVNKLDLEEWTIAAYKNPDNDIRWPYRLLWAWARWSQGWSKFDITSKSGQYFPERLWLFNKESFERLDSDNRLTFNWDKVYRKLFLTENQWSIPETIWQDVWNAANAADEIKEIFESQIFQTPKPTTYIEKIIQIASNPWDIILDSFAWSGTTAHAVLNLNKRDDGNRKFILIETEEYAETITAERVKRVIRWYSKTEWTGGDYTYYTLGSPLMTPEWLISEDASVADIRSYVCYTETGHTIPSVPLIDHPYWLARTEDRDHYFYYERDSLTVLDREFLSTITESQPYYTIWADRCDIPLSLMKKQGITFRKIPRDIRNI